MRNYYRKSSNKHELNESLLELQNGNNKRDRVTKNNIFEE